MRIILILSIIFGCWAPAFAQDPCDDLQIDFSHAPHPNGLQFTDGSTYPGVVTWYQWTFGDGNISFAQNPIHGFDINGTYEVCLTIGISIDTPDGPVECLDSTCQMVVYSDGGGFSCDQYSASFEYEIQEGNSVLFYNTTEPFGGDHIWQFGDGNSYIGPQFTHTYAEPGEYNVCLVSFIWSSALEEYCYSNACTTILVGVDSLDCDALQANFTGTLISGTTMVFQETTSPTANSFNWDFGDNSTANGAEVTHTFATSGTYQVCMGAFWWNDLTLDSCFVSYCDLFHIVDTIDCDPSFSAGFNWSHVDGTAWLQANSSGIAEGYIWDLGDGNSTEGETVSHDFNVGEYEVCLTAWYLPQIDGDTCWAFSCDTIQIDMGSTSCDELAVSFEYESIASGVQFENISLVPGVPFLIEWDFGDGSTATGAAPLHGYDQVGEYDVCLTIWSLIGDPALPDTCMATHCAPVVWDGATGDICAGFDAAFIGSDGGGLQMEFQSTSDPAGDGFFWEFGDGSSGTGEQVTHIYDQPNTYEVCLTTWWWVEAEQDTCWSTICEFFSVSGEVTECDTLFAVQISMEQQGNEITLAGSTNLSADGIIWDFGDGTNGLGDTIAHTYLSPGQYTICASAWYWNESTQDSCWATQCDDVFIGPGGCDPGFTADIIVDGSGNTFVFTAETSFDADGYLWDFGDGTTGSGETVTHVFEPPGPFTVCVDPWYWDPLGQDTCWAEACMEVDPFVGIEEISSSNALLIYPQPANSIVIIDAERGTPLPREAMLYTLDGRWLMLGRIQAWPHIMPVNELAPGLYFLRLGFDDHAVIERIMIE